MNLAFSFIRTGEKANKILFMQQSLFSIRYIYIIYNISSRDWGGGLGGGWSEQVKYIVNIIKGQELLKVNFATGKA